MFGLEEDSNDDFETMIKLKQFPTGDDINICPWNYREVQDYQSIEKSNKKRYKRQNIRDQSNRSVPIQQRAILMNKNNRPCHIFKRNGQIPQKKTIKSLFINIPIKMPAIHEKKFKIISSVKRVETEPCQLNQHQSCTKKLTTLYLNREHRMFSRRKKIDTKDINILCLRHLKEQERNQQKYGEKRKYSEKISNSKNCLDQQKRASTFNRHPSKKYSLT